jgi:hypothetical protein
VIESIRIDCPYCGEAFESSADTSAGAQTYVEDCAVCCRPIVVSIELGDDDALESVTFRREQD